MYAATFITRAAGSADDGFDTDIAAYTDAEGRLWLSVAGAAPLPVVEVTPLPAAGLVAVTGADDAERELTLCTVAEWGAVKLEAAPLPPLDSFDRRDEPVLPPDARAALVADGLRNVVRDAVHAQAARIAQAPAAPVVTVEREPVDGGPPLGYNVVRLVAGDQVLSWDADDPAVISLGSADSSFAELRQLRALLNHPELAALLD